MAETFVIRDPVDDSVISTLVAHRSEQYFARLIRGVVWRQVTVRELPADEVQHAVELPPESGLREREVG